MAFFHRVGSLLKRTVNIHGTFSAPNSSLFQAIRSMSSSSKVFVGGLSYSTDEYGLREAFSQYGEVVEARIIMDRESGRSRGFGFVTYTSSEAASNAIQAYDGQDLHGRRIRVNYATEKPRVGGFGGGFGGGGGGFSYGGQGGNFGGGGYQGGYAGAGGGFGGNDQYPRGDGGRYGGDNNTYPSGGTGYGGAGNFPNAGFTGINDESPGTLEEGTPVGMAAGDEDFERVVSDEPSDYANAKR